MSDHAPIAALAAKKSRRERPAGSVAGFRERTFMAGSSGEAEEFTGDCSEPRPRIDRGDESFAKN
jgi:hypothetical protein